MDCLARILRVEDEPVNRFQVALFNAAIKVVLPFGAQLRTSQMVNQRHNWIGMSSLICTDQGWMIEFVLDENIERLVIGGLLRSTRNDIWKREPETKIIRQNFDPGKKDIL